MKYLIKGIELNANDFFNNEICHLLTNRLLRKVWNRLNRLKSIDQLDRGSLKKKVL